MISRLHIAGSGVAITRIGFGCGRIFGGSELKTSARLIETALSTGIRHFDTAPSYGNGESEAVLGEILAGIQDVTIATKIGIPRPDASAVQLPVRSLYRRTLRPILANFPLAKRKLIELASRSGNVVAEHAPTMARRKLHPAEVLRGLEDSLKRLKRNRVDLYLIHEPDRFELTDELLELFDTLQHNGTISAFGLAYDRFADTAPPVGTVIQCRHVADFPARTVAGQTRIFHGVIRHSWHATGRRVGYDRPGNYVREVLAMHPDTAIIFSASLPRQITQLMKGLSE